MKKVYLITVVLLFSLILFGLGFFITIQHYAATASMTANSKIYDVPKGVSLASLAQKLSQANIISHPTLFIWLARFRGVSKQLQAGEYEFVARGTPNDVLEKIVSGRVKQYDLTLIAGWNFHQVMHALNTNPHLKHTLKGLPQKTVMSRVKGAYLSPEGMFFPDTYRFTKGTPDIMILKTAFRRMQTVLVQSWHQRAKGLPYKTPYQALIVASMLEKETALPEERRLITGVIINRLQRNMPLQLDPTVLYSLGPDYHGKLTSRSLLTKSPYNTYINKGLPPSPIALPSENAIKSALHPIASNYIYFVAKGNGEHHFSRSLKAHDQAIKHYQLKISQHSSDKKRQKI